MCAVCQIGEHEDRLDRLESGFSALSFAVIILCAAILYDAGFFKGVLRA